MKRRKRERKRGRENWVVYKEACFDKYLKRRFATNKQKKLG